MADQPEFWLQSSFWIGVVGAGIGILGFLLPYVRERRHREESAARAAAQIAHDFFALIVDRLRIRFTPELIDTEGLMLRELRATAALEMLKEIRFADLPKGAQEPFIRFRSAAQALQLAMNTERRKRDVPLDDYARVYSLLLDAHTALQAALWKRTRVERPIATWSPPPIWRRLNWSERAGERRNRKRK